MSFSLSCYNEEHKKCNYGYCKCDCHHKNPPKKPPEKPDKT